MTFFPTPCLLKNQNLNEYKDILFNWMQKKKYLIKYKTPRIFVN